MSYVFDERLKCATLAVTEAQNDHERAVSLAISYYKKRMIRDISIGEVNSLTQLVEGLLKDNSEEI